MKAADKKREKGAAGDSTVVPEEASAGKIPLVAIGASAGGLEVFQQFFTQMPVESGLAFVLLQHLDPEHETLLPELLARHTSIPVERVVEPVAVAANHIYVIPANAMLTLEKGILRVHPLAGTLHNRMPIDHFFKSAAPELGQNFVAVILSGNGSDGTLGLKAVKEQGGMTIAQAVETAKYDSMPRNAISTGLVDHVMPAEEMPARIIDYVRHLDALERKKGAAGLQEEIVKVLPKILPVLLRKTGHDFSRYRQSTLVRRIQRRMQVLYFESAAKYLERLKGDEKEVENLFKDLLIGVTQFFRDPEAFEALSREVILEMF